MKREGTKQEELARDKYDTRDAGYFKMLAEQQKRIEEERKKVQERPGYLRRKFNRIFGGLGNTGGKFFIGFQQGFMVGAIIGLVSGGIMAFRARRVSILLISPIISGASFGFFMGVGYIVRSAPRSTSPTVLQPYLQDRSWVLSKSFPDNPTV